MSNASTVNPFPPIYAKLKGKDRTEYDKTLDKIVGSPKPVPANSILTPKGPTKDNPLYQGADMFYQGAKKVISVANAKVPGTENTAGGDAPAIGPAGVIGAAEKAGGIIEGIGEANAAGKIGNIFGSGAKAGEVAETAEAGNAAKVTEAGEQGGKTINSGKSKIESVMGKAKNDERFTEKTLNELQSHATDDNAGLIDHMLENPRDFKPWQIIGVAEHLKKNPGDTNYVNYLLKTGEIDGENIGPLLNSNADREKVKRVIETFKKCDTGAPPYDYLVGMSHLDDSASKYLEPVLRAKGSNGANKFLRIRDTDDMLKSINELNAPFADDIINSPRINAQETWKIMRLIDEKTAPHIKSLINNPHLDGKNIVDALKLNKQLRK